MLVPKLRFKREDGTDYPEWENQRIGDCLTYEQPTKYIVKSEQYDDNCKTPVLTANKGFILGYTDEKDGIYNKGDVIIYDDFTMDMKYVRFEFKVKSSAMKMLTATDDNNLYFMYLLLVSLNLHQEVHSRSYISQVEPMVVQIPDLEEQKKIADFLSTVDEVIAQSEAEVQNLEQQKKAAMQKIFSQEVRFKREDGTEYPEWEEDIIGNCVNVTSCKRVHQSDWTDSGVPFYRAREIVALYNNEPITPLHISIEKYNALSKISGMISSGDLLVTGVGTIGVPYLVKESDKFYFKDGNIIWFQNEEKRALGSFLYYTLSTNEFQTKILQDSGKGTVHTFTIANAKETIIAIPCLEEQKKIANFLSAYDEAIRCAKQELDKWKELKKGLLQQMFV